MKLVSKIAGISVLAVAGSVIALVPANADAAQTVTVGQSAITPDTESNTSDHTELTRDGLVMATDAGGKNLQYFDYAGSTALEDLHTIDYDWVGTTNSASISVVIDKEGDGKWDGSLVYQHGDNVGNLWASNRTIANVPGAPHVANSGSASTSNGPIDAWQAALPNAEIMYMGVNIGSTGTATAPIGGLLKSVTFNDVLYKFTSEVAPAEKVTKDVTGYSTATKVTPRKVRLDLFSKDLKADQVEGNRLAWTIKVDGRTAFSTKQHADDHDRWTRTFTKNTGRHTVELFKNGQLVRTIKVNTNA